MTPFWKKWWFWALAVLVALSMPMALKYAADSPAAPAEEVSNEKPPESDGLEGSPVLPAPEPEPDASREQTPEPEPEPEPVPEPNPETEPISEPEPIPEPEPETIPEPIPEPEPETIPEPILEPEPEPIPDPGPDREPDPEPSPAATYILNTNTKKFHRPDCSSVSTIKEKNKQEYTGPRDDLIAQGYAPCKRCNP